MRYMFIYVHCHFVCFFSFCLNWSFSFSLSWRWLFFSGTIKICSRNLRTFSLVIDKRWYYREWWFMYAMKPCSSLSHPISYLLSILLTLYAIIIGITTPELPRFVMSEFCHLQFNHHSWILISCKLIVNHHYRNHH